MLKTRFFFYHFLAWLLFFLLPLLSIWPNSAALMRLPRPPSMFWVSSLLLVFTFYANAYWLMPRYFLKKKYGHFLLGALALLFLRAAILWAVPLSDLPLPPGFARNSAVPFHKVFLVFPGIAILVISTAFRLVIAHFQNERRYKERETESLRSELRFLRSQISPHFLFNVLNSLTALARKKSDLLEPSLLKLSELMRYTLYETEQDQIPLERELDYIQSYINLQQLRFEEQMRLDIRIEHSGIVHQQIAPMLLIPLIENAFKYSTQVVEKPFIELHLYLNATAHLILEIKNACIPEPEKTAGEANTGLGLSNLRRRLSLLYPGRFILEAEHLSDHFVAKLEIAL
jgi:hypothetical protein